MRSCTTVRRSELLSALQLADNALTLVRERATRHGITLTQTVDERLGDIVADERKVKQILLNLLSNAVRFTGSALHDVDLGQMEHERARRNAR